MRTYRSELGILFLSHFNKDVVKRMIHSADLKFTPLFTAKPHVFVSRKNPLAKQDTVTLEDLQEYPRLTYEQGLNNSFYFSEELHSTEESPQSIIVTDRTSLFNLLDDCSWGLFFGQELTEESKVFANQLLKVNNLAVAKAPSDMVINTHICRGNYNSDYFGQGAYDSVAKIIFGDENVEAYYLEFDDERSGGFEPLKEVSGDKKVVLGLITSKRPELENKEDVIARIHEAAKYVPLDRLYLSPQCGFASCEIGNKLTEDEQWAKLTLVKEIAEEVWGK